MKQLVSKLGTLGIVTVVTLLVWLYAEDANIVEYTNQTVRLEFEVAGQENGQLTPAGVITVQVDFDGSNGQYQQFIAKTREQVIQINPPFRMRGDIESVEVDLRRELLESDEFRDLGINIKDISPATVTVRFEKNINLTLGMPKVLLAPGIDLAELPEISNAQPIMILNLPAGLKDAFKDVVPFVRVRPEDVAGLPKGEQRQIRLPVQLPGDFEGITPSPATVDVLVKLANDIDRIKIERRPILLTYPPSINERYIIDIDEPDRFINTFELEGPREQIARIKEDPAGPLVWATVRLTNQEVDQAVADGGELTKAVEIIAPAGVVPVSVAERVTIRVTPRPAPSP